MTRLSLNIPSMLIAICCGLTLVVLYQLIAPLPGLVVPTPAPVVLPAPIAIAALPNSLARSFDAILKRPLFSPDRKAVEPRQKAAEAPAQLAPPEITLLGVIIDSQRHLALVRAPEFPFATSISEGATIGGWSVVAIEPASVLLQSAAQQIRIALNAKSPAAQNPAPVRTNTAASPGP